ncbi:MAG: FG-GAP-like repeat-containing protein [Acidobacteria bacterium]|nr:FG-GAP-like repeat-containing protein [Acidobacteriota bacterium]
MSRHQFVTLFSPILVATYSLLLFTLAINFSSCNRTGKLPSPSSNEYREAVSAFYIGLGALQATDDIRAKGKLTQFTQLAPGEPAGWANLGVLALRQQEFDAAYENLEKARAIVPDNSRIESMLGLVESKRGKFAEAIAHLRKAVDLDQKNLKALYALAQEVERQGGENSDVEAKGLIEKILQAQPDNLAAQLELTRIAAKRGDAETARKAVARIGERASNWPPEINKQFDALQMAVNGPNVRAAASQVAFLRNVLVRLPEYRQSLSAIKNPTEETGEPFEKFLKMPTPKFGPAAPDEAIAFGVEPLIGLEGKWFWASAVSLNGEGTPAMVVANGREARVGDDLRLSFPGGTSSTPPKPDGILGLDFNYDFKTDLVMAGDGGVKLYRQESPGNFVEITSRTGVPANLTRAAYVGAWAADIDLDGDLDIVLGSVDGSPVVLRNNGDSTFKELRPFTTASKLRSFVYADLDSDGDPDAALINEEGKLQVFANERLGQFRERSVPSELDYIFVICAGDMNNDGVMDLVLFNKARKLLRLSLKAEGREWEIVELGKYPETGESRESLPAGWYRLLAADLDNNGSLDLSVSGGRSQLWLSDQQGRFQRPVAMFANSTLSMADLTGDGRLDGVGADSNGKAVRMINRGTKNYHWQVIRPRAAKATGDQRINSFGIGGEIEVLAGLLFLKQVINFPIVHFGLGEQTQTDVARIIWPNGSIQGEFELKSDQTILVEQRLKGSCPSLFAWNGKSIEFVKDCAPWSPALGLHINAQVTAGIQQTEEWMKLRGDQLAPRDGFYDLRITAELWETYYLDHYSLMVVDHPANTEIFTDERFAIPPPELKIYSTNRPKPFARAIDDNGRDVTETVRALDDKYMDTFGRGRYQGVTRDHFIELELPNEAPRAGQLWLIAHGFVHPTDGTVNIAMSQPDNYTPPKGLSLEASDGKGGWRIVNPALGFPAGKKKTILIDLTKVITTNAPRRIRLRTNMELFWDKLEWAAGLPDGQIKMQRLEAEKADLRFRGFSLMRRADDSSPELPDYNQLEFTGQKWRDLIGYYTRYGDICELLAKVDDRFVIVNAGDEMRFHFKAIPDPPEGWTRDYVLVGNGWIKDGDYNSTFSKTVLPLPDLKMREYTTPPERLEDDPVYRRHARDWQKFHTRYVTPDRFRNAMRPKSR